MKAGYSSRSLVDKLGLKPATRVALYNPPPEYFELVEWPESLVFSQDLADDQLDWLHFFTTSEKELRQQFPKLKALLQPAGQLWISWPKGGAPITTDLNENRIRHIGLEHGLVDVKVIAVDANWSGLKFVFRLTDRLNSAKRH